MMRNERGFTIVELMITMIIFLMVITASSQIFVAMITQFKQQSKIAESNIEGIVGLDMLRHNVADAGYGLFWFTAGGLSYSEAASAPYNSYNDGAGIPPRAIAHGDNTEMNSSDHLVVKSVTSALNDTAQRWAYIVNQGGSTNVLKSWGSGSTDNLVNGDKVVVMRPSSGTSLRLLVNGGGSNFWTTFNTDLTKMSSTFYPASNSYEYLILYGIDPSTTPRMPFNRSDYYVKRPTSGMPKRCSWSTHIGNLYRATINHADGGVTELPIFDCVVDMQVRFWLDTDSTIDGIVNAPSASDLNGLSADYIRDRLREVRIYILAQEGQRDPNLDFSQGGTVKTLTTLEYYPDGSSHGVMLPGTGDLETLFGSSYKYYRWKVYTIAVQPNNLK